MAFVLAPEPRPRDLKTSNNTSEDNPLYQDFRFKGYPSEGFFNPHNPQYKRNSAAMNGSDVNRYFGKSQHFDSDYYARPKLDEGHRSLQYGSGDPRIEESQQVRPGPMRGLGFDNRDEIERDRLRREMMDTEQDRQRIKYQEQIRLRDREDERKRDMEMLKNYNPWGRPGGGAPMADARKQKFTEHQLEPPEKHVYKDKWDPAFPDLERIDFRKEIAQDRPGYDPSGPRDRTRLEQMKRDPDFQQKQDMLHNQEEKLHTLKQELDHLKAAAVTPRRPDSFQERRQNGYNDSYERGGNPRTAPETNRSATNPFEEYDNLGRIGKPKKPNMELHPIYHPFGRAGGGAPVKDYSGKISTVLHGHSDRHYLHNNLSDYERRQNAIKAKIYYAELGQQMENQQYKKKMEMEEKRKPHGELAVIIDDKLTGKPRRDPITGALQNHHLGNSDVSLQKMGSQPRNISEQRNYHNFLDNMTEERFRRNALGKMKDYQEGQRHYDTMDSLWGRPGGGAPKGYTMRKMNLDEIIHHPTKDKATEEYVRKHDWSEVEPEKFFSKDDDEYISSRSPRQNPMLSARDIQEGRLSPGAKPKKFIKSTVTSSHANMFDYREDYPQKDYKVGAPYATGIEG